MSATVAPDDRAARLAAEYGVSRRTIFNDAKFARAVDVIAANCGADVKQSLLSGKLKITKKATIAFATLPAEHQRAAIQGGREVILRAIAKRSTPEDHVSRLAASVLRTIANWSEDDRQELLRRLSLEGGA